MLNLKVNYHMNQSIQIKLYTHTQYNFIVKIVNIQTKPATISVRNTMHIM